MIEALWVIIEIIFLCNSLTVHCDYKSFLVVQCRKYWKGLKTLIRGSCAQRGQTMKIKAENVLTSVAKFFMKKYRIDFAFFKYLT